MQPQIELCTMLSALILAGVILGFSPVQGVLQIPVPTLTERESMNSVAELSVWESLGISDADFNSDDHFVTSLGLGPPPDYDSMRFVLFNQADRTKGTVVTADCESLKKTLNKKVPTKVIVHGFQNDLNSEVPLVLKNAYLDHGDYNLIFVDWAKLAKPPNYVAARSHVVGVANRTALLLNALDDSDISKHKEQHIIGHSLGGQIAGLAAGQAKEAVGRATGLDPAGPLFQVSTDKGRIDPTDAILVDIIHTTASLWGFPGPIGDIDFYPNGGVWPQPGCPIDIDGTCSHAMSARFFAYTISNPTAFNATQCQTHGIIRGDCPGSDVYATMGEHIQFQTPGMYYLQAKLPTNSKDPATTKTAFCP